MRDIGEEGLRGKGQGIRKTIVANGVSIAKAKALFIEDFEASLK
jgi:hypothetical protein